MICFDSASLYVPYFSTTSIHMYIVNDSLEFKCRLFHHFKSPSALTVMVALLIYRICSSVVSSYYPGLVDNKGIALTIEICSTCTSAPKCGLRIEEH